MTSTERMKKLRCRETPQQREKRITAMKKRNAIMRSKLTDKKKNERREEQKKRDASRRANESPEQRELRKLKNREAMRKKRASLRSKEKVNPNNKRAKQQQVNDECDVNDTLEELLSDEDINKAKMEALKYLHRTQIEDTDLHKAHVCVICDMFILGVEDVKWLSSEKIEQHRNRLSVSKYKEFYNIQDNNNTEDQLQDLWDYYHLPGHKGMLLSKRARKNSKQKYSCCCGCFNAMRASRKDKKPPKMSIANGFAIGAMPLIIWKDDDGNEHVIDVEENVTDVTRALIAPIRTHGYVMAFTGGAHKSIQGHYQFFEMDLNKIGGSLHHIKHSHKKQHVYCMMSGRFTPSQRRRINNECKVDMNIYSHLTKWFVEKSGHPGFKDILIPEECPQPTIIQDKADNNNTDTSRNHEEENKFESASYFFSTAQDPQPSTSVYRTNKNFTVAMLNESNPKLLVYGGNYAKMGEIKVENLLPFAFPFGMGGPKSKRPTRVSFELCLQRYMRLAMRQFMRGDVILVMHHMYARQLSYKSGVMTCRNNIGGESYGEKFSKISVESLTKAIDENNPSTDPTTKQFFKSISTSCKAMGHTPEAAQFARRCCFAMQDYFGLNSVFITISPCDECSFRVRLYAMADKSGPGNDWNKVCASILMPTYLLYQTIYEKLTSW